MYDPKLYNEFIKFLEGSIRDHLKYLEKTLKENADFRYGDASRKIEIIDNLQENENTGHFNHIKAKGVSYTGTVPELVKDEIKELIDYCGVNLENEKNGRFNNENDLDKPLAYKSVSQLNFMVCYSLTIQFYAIEKNKLKIGFTEFDNDIFIDAKSQKFFEEKIVNEWLNIEENKKTALSYAFRRMNVKYSKEKEMPFKIHCRATYFVSEYWNKNFSNILEIENPKNPKLEEVRNPEPYRAEFDKLEERFKDNYI